MGKNVVTVLRPIRRQLKPRDLKEAAFELEKNSTTTLIEINGLLSEDTNLATINMDASNKPPSQDIPDGGAPEAHTARNPPIQCSTPIPGQNFIATEAINEAAATTLEGISNWITVIIATFKDLLVNQAKNRLCSMTYPILFMAMDENSTRVQITHLITAFFSAVRSTNEDI